MDNLTSEASTQIQQLNSLIERAKNLKSSSHPGKTSEFVEWKSELETFLTRNCGVNSQEWQKFCSLMFFPRWYDSKKHGPLPKDVPGIVAADSNENDRQTALTFFNDALTESIGIMKGLVTYISNSGWGLHVKDNGSKESNSPVFQTTFSQVQGQIQSQEQNISIEQSIQLTLEKIKESYGDEDAKKAEELLTELKKDKKWTTVQKVSSWFLDLGREAFIALLPTLIKILLGNNA